MAYELYTIWAVDLKGLKYKKNKQQQPEHVVFLLSSEFWVVDQVVELALEGMG